MWELEKRELKISTIKKIANVFGVPVEEIIKETEVPIKKENEMAKKTKQKKKVIFELMAPEAQNVLLTGDFNSWDNNGIAMRRSKNGLWKTDLELDSGDYQYKFIVDNQWWTDPNNDMKVNNNFGDVNSVKKVTG